MMRKPIISLIWAMSLNRVIGRANQLPWHLSADLQHFKALTLGKPILMGRKTWESLPGLLPGRTHIVLSLDQTYQAEGCVVAHSIEDALLAAGDAPEVMVVGGAALYRAMLPHASRFYLTLVQIETDGDAFFPAYTEAEWTEVRREEHPADKQNPFPYTFIDYRKKQDS